VGSEAVQKASRRIAAAKTAEAHHRHNPSYPEERLSNPYVQAKIIKIILISDSGNALFQKKSPEKGLVKKNCKKGCEIEK